MKTIFFLIKTSLIIALTAWIIQYKGGIEITLEERTIHLSWAESCLSLACIIGAFFLIGYGYFFLTKGRRYRQKIKKLEYLEKAFEYFTKSYAAFLMKEGNTAQEWVQKSRKILGDSCFIIYLEAQAAYLQEEKPLATTLFKKITDQQYPIFGLVPLIEHNLISPKDSILLLKKVIDKNPQEKALWVLLFQEALKEKNLAEATESFQKLEKLGISSKILADYEPPLLLLKRDNALSKGNVDKALEFSHKAYLSNPKDEKNIIPYIRDLAHTGQRQKALEILSKRWREDTSLTLAQNFKEITAGMEEEEKVKWKNHLLNSPSDAIVKNFLSN
jgi:uncharacterized membrane-anchored protein